MTDIRNTTGKVDMSETLHRDELIAQARDIGIAERVLIDYCIEQGEDGILAACEQFYLNGFADDQYGSMTEGPFHVYRVNRWIVETDPAGNHEVYDCNTASKAEKSFEDWCKEYRR